MSTHHRKLKVVQFALDASNFECQIQTWKLSPGIDEGEHMYAFCPDGGFIEEPQPEGTLEITFYSDWTQGGISDFLWQNSGQEATFTLDHHPDIPAEHVQFTGRVRLVAPPVGGEARTTELSEVTLQIIGNVTDGGYTRVGV